MVGTLAGCTPLVHHGPWVREGLSGDILSSGSLLASSETDGSGFLLGVDAGIRYGFVPSDSALPALGLGIQLPLLPFLITTAEADATFAQLITGDVYVSAFKSATTTTAIGLSKSVYHTMPYIQIGSRDLVKGSWYTTQAFMLTDDDHMMWLPSFTWVDPSKTKPRVSHITVGGGLGREDSETRYMLTVGITMEFHRRDARVR